MVRRESGRGDDETYPSLRHPRAEQAEGRCGDPRIHAVTRRQCVEGAEGPHSEPPCTPNPHGMDPRVVPFAALRLARG
jgi:hypothetical protein